MLFPVPLRRGSKTLRATGLLSKSERKRCQKLEKKLEKWLPAVAKTVGGSLIKEQTESGEIASFRITGRWGDRFANSELVSGNDGYFRISLICEDAIGGSKFFSVRLEGSDYSQIIELESQKLLEEKCLDFSKRCLVAD